MIKIIQDGDIRKDLTKIGLISKEAMIESSSKSGNKVRENARRFFKSSTTDWVQNFVNGERVLEKTTPQPLGHRVSHKNKTVIGEGARNMVNLITSYTMERTGTTVVGGSHREFTPSTIRDGKIVGTQKKVGRVTKGARAILEKLNTGDEKGGNNSFDQVQWRKKGGGYSSESIANFKGKWKKNRDFMGKGYLVSQGYMKQTMTTGLRDLIGKQANNIKANRERHVI